MVKEKLKRRQYVYKVGSIVEFTDRLGYWLRRKRIESGDFGVVIFADEQSSIKVKHINTNYELWVSKSKEVRLLSNEMAIMEKL